MTTKATNTSPWSKEDLLKKALRYSQIMCGHPKDSWDYAFWSSLVLELLARSALSNVNPVLLADPHDWNNIYSALGHTPTAPKFNPKSIDITSVFTRLKEVVPGFTSEHLSFGILHMSRRNEELHSGVASFDTNNSLWLPSFYQVCEILLSSMGEDLDLLLGKTEAVIAKTMIEASNDHSAKAIKGQVNAFKVTWNSKDADEQKKLTSQASVWATKQSGHRVKCPSCNNDALVIGQAAAPPIKSIKADDIIEKQEFLPEKFECVACGLKISGLSHLNACGLGDTYTATFVYDAAEYYAPEAADFDSYEPDFND